MKKMKSSIVAKSFVGALALFLLFWAVVPYVLFFYAALSAAFGVCLAATIRYGRDAFISFRNGRAGADFLVVAIFAIVSIVLCLISYWFAIRAFPDQFGWLSRSAVSVGVPWFLAWAMSLALIAPDVGADATEAKTGIWRSIALFIGGALAGFVIAISFGADGIVEMSKASTPIRLVNRAICKSSEPIWVSSNRIYHTLDSPYRVSLTPKWCFANEQDAISAGYRKFKAVKALNRPDK